MGKRTWIFGAWMSILLGPLCASAAWAKPADLPVPSQPECVGGKDEPEHGSLSITLDILTGRISVEIRPATEPLPAIDAVSPTFLPALLERLLTQAGNALTPRPATAQEKLADQLFRDAEQCARQGEFQKARLFYQQTHLLAPTSKIGLRDRPLAANRGTHARRHRGIDRSARRLHRSGSVVPRHPQPHHPAGPGHRVVLIGRHGPKSMRAGRPWPEAPPLLRAGPRGFPYCPRCLPYARICPDASSSLAQRTLDLTRTRRLL